MSTAQPARSGTLAGSIATIRARTSAGRSDSARAAGRRRSRRARRRRGRQRGGDAAKARPGRRGKLPSRRWRAAKRRRRARCCGPRRSVHAPTAGCRGKVAVNVVPSGADESATTSPPCARAISRTMNRPRPTLRRPPAGLPRVIGSKSVGSSSRRDRRAVVVHRRPRTRRRRCARSPSRAGRARRRRARWRRGCRSAARAGRHRRRRRRADRHVLESRRPAKASAQLVDALVGHGVQVERLQRRSLRAAAEPRLVKSSRSAISRFARAADARRAGSSAALLARRELAQPSSCAPIWIADSGLRRSWLTMPIICSANSARSSAVACCRRARLRGQRRCAAAPCEQLFGALARSTSSRSYLSRSRATNDRDLVHDRARRARGAARSAPSAAAAVARARARASPRRPSPASAAAAPSASGGRCGRPW